MRDILLVEDNEMNRDMLSRRLQRRGFTVQLARDGMEALTEIDRQQPDLILMDMSLPLLSGWEVTKKIKENPVTAGIPIIALTAHVMPGDRQRALDVGCDDFDVKPVDFNRLIDKIEAFVSRDRE